MAAEAWLLERARWERVLSDEEIEGGIARMSVLIDTADARALDEMNSIRRFLRFKQLAPESLLGD